MSMLSKLKNFVIGGPQRSNVHVGAQPKHIGQPDNYTPGILTFHQSKLEVPAAAKKCIYAISSNQTDQYMLNNKFFLDQEKARTRLRKMADERRHNLGVRFFKTG